MIERVDRHLDTPWVKRFGQNAFYRGPLPINYSVVKVSGR